jgi:hypothetical protein
MPHVGMLDCFWEAEGELAKLVSGHVSFLLRGTNDAAGEKSSDSTDTLS